ncbi:hypothetical protein BC629DRAFT_1596351 [Irpex lacteus]|nr:hypothetical protein BC629DRAFT_1596351 [Irpex lacteus]
MPARYNSSAASSLYSQPMHSRASSRTAVVTPLEDFRTSRYIPTDNLAPVEVPRSKNISRTSTFSSKQYAADAAAVPYESYFSIPVAHDSRPDTPASKRSTKELVGKYESLSHATTSKPSRPSIASSKQSNLATPENREKKKGKSPIRQSFRNILSVFSKKGRSTRDPSITATPELLDANPQVKSLLSPKVPKLEPLTIPGASPAPRAVASPIACNTPSSLHSGRLFHMSRQASGSLPVWTDCDILLHPTHMLITWMTSLSNPSTEIVALAQCTDVRSLSVEDLAEEERGMLPTVTEPNGVFVFELLFEGKGREKFVAHSLKDRAGWVSAIWDAVLRMSEEKTYTPSISALREITQLETPLSSPFRGYGTDGLPTTPVAKNAPAIPTPVEPDLPPLPAPTTPLAKNVLNSPIRVSLYDPPVPQPTSLVSTPTRTPTRTAPSLLSTPASSRSQSPSIRNLDKISMVKQRLAQIEASSSQSGSPQFPTDKSTRARQIIRPPTESPMDGQKRSVLLRHGTITTIGGDSVMGMQASETQESPLQHTSRPLASIPSGESLGTEANPWSTYSRLSTPEPLRRMGSTSVSSRYSNESSLTERPSLLGSNISNAAKPLPPLVLALRESHSSDGGESPSTSSRTETPRSTRGLSIFSPSSPYSYNAVQEERQTEGTSLSTTTPLNVRKSTPISTPAELTPSHADTNRLEARRESRNSQQRSGFSAVSRYSTDTPKMTSLTKPSPSPKPCTQSSPEAPRTGKTLPVVSPSQPMERYQTISKDFEPQLPPPSLSVFSPQWGSEDSSTTESPPVAALFSRFAKVLPDLPPTYKPATPVPRREPSAPTPVANKESQARLSLLEGKLGDVQVELQNLPGRIRALAAEQPAPATSSPPVVVQDPEAKKLLQDIDNGLKRVEDQGASHVESLSGVHAKIDKLLARRNSEAVSRALLGQHAISGLPNLPTQSNAENLDTAQLMDKLEEMRNEFKSDLPTLVQKLEDVLATKFSDNNPTAILSDAAMHDGKGSDSEKVVVPTIDTTAIHEKLDELLVALQAKASTSVEPVEQPSTEEPNAMLQQVLELLTSDKEDRAKVIEQQADSARYLNELNTWLETFVNHGTSQIESVAGGVQQLCNDLGPSDVIGEDGQPVQHAGLLADIRQLLAENKGRDENMTALHGSVGGLMAAVQENLQQGAELRSMFNPETMAGMIDQQRHNQEQMLRNLALELSDDIRGERLRFVEAMKEATTINVQIHVEEFKKELTREVTLMTQEVDRLHKERQGLEQHIADLFAFYAKQKQVAPGDQRRKGKHLQPRTQAPPMLQNAPSQVPQAQNVYYGVPGVPGFMGPSV